MSELRKIPLSFLFILIGIMGIPAICYGTLQFFHPSQPDKIYSQQGSEKVEWTKLTYTDNYSEYISNYKNIDDDGMKVNILVLRNYFEPQTEIMKTFPVTYSSAVLHETINCNNHKITDENIFVYSENFAKGKLLRAMIDIQSESDIAEIGTVAHRKILTLCGSIT